MAWSRDNVGSDFVVPFGSWSILMRSSCGGGGRRSSTEGMVEGEGGIFPGVMFSHGVPAVLHGWGWVSMECATDAGVECLLVSSQFR